MGLTMTRINVVPVSELSDQHLIAEYHELPRVLKQDINIADAPERYCLGKGHIKWAKRHSIFTACRYGQLLREMHHRGFKTNFTDSGPELFTAQIRYYDYDPTDEDVELNRQRIREKYNMKPNWYRWTKRTKPYWLN